MSKLFHMRDWVSLEEAAKHLSIVFKEDVSDLDVLSLGASDKLKLSVRIDTPAMMQMCRFVTHEQAQTDPADCGDSDSLAFNGAVFSLGSAHEETVWIIERATVRPVPLSGLYDLLMLGGDKLSVEAELHRRRGRKAPDVNAFNDIYLREPSFRSWPDEPLTSPGRPFKLLEEMEGCSWQPATRLPYESEIVVRPQAVAQFIESEADPQDRPIAERERTNLLNVIGALLDACGTKESALINSLIDKYPDKPGLKKRTLEQKFAEAKRSLEAT